MGSIKLEITNPIHNSTFMGIDADNIQLVGKIDHPSSKSLFYKWYSSLYSPAGIETAEDVSKAALNCPNHSYVALKFPTALSVGSHIITLAVKDIEGDSMADIKAVKEAGIAGGPDIGGTNTPCVIHVFKATIITPPENVQWPKLSLSNNDNVLVAKAPLKWGMKDKDDNYVPDDNYHAINRIRFRWRFEPQEDGSPVGLPPLEATDDELTAFQEKLAFDIIDDTSVPVVRYKGKLPDTLTTGMYKLVLRIEDKQVPHNGDEDSIEVEIIE